MRTLPQNLLSELEGGTDNINYLVYLLDIETPIPGYITNADQCVYYEDKIYQPGGFDLGRTEYSISPIVDKISCEMDNANRTLSSTVLIMEVRGRRFLVRLAALNQNMAVIGTVILFDGIIDSIRVNKKSVKFDIYNHMILWKKLIPRRTHQSTCTWVFKDIATCKYIGQATTCDKSYDQCLSYGNDLNFGGFRWLPSVSNKDIWWGIAPK